MDTSVKSNLLALMSDARDRQQQVTELAVSLEALIETLKILNPGFEEIYAEQLQSPERDPLRQEGERVLSLVQSAIHFLESQ